MKISISIRVGGTLYIRSTPRRYEQRNGGIRGHEAISETVRVEHGDADLSPSRAVIEAVAGAAGVDPVDLADEAGSSSTTTST